MALSIRIMDCRKIIHIDMDAFFAAVEQRNDPQLRGKPVIVGGNPDSRGVVASCSYEARRFGVHSAMPSRTARKICPQAIFVRGDYEEYVSISRQIREIFYEYTDLVEPLSIDEAYLDVTVNKKNIPSATAIAVEIRKKIKSITGLTASAGVSFNKFLAKVASDHNKPDGITVITPERSASFIDRLPIGKFYGIGRVTEKKMKDMGINNGADLKKMAKDDLMRLFGKSGEYYYEIAHGIDERPVVPARVRKSMGRETTLKQDTSDLSLMSGLLKSLSCSVSEDLQNRNRKGRTVTLKIKYYDFESITRSITLPAAVDSWEILFMHAENLLSKTEAGNRKVRLLGISVSNLDDEIDVDSDEQLTLPF